MKNKQTGITLIALVITIILLLILAGITISSLGGENGLFAKTKQSKIEQMKAEAKENITLAIMQIQIDDAEQGKETTLQSLHDKLPTTDTRIGVEDYNTGEIELNGIYDAGEKKFKYTIDEFFNVTIGDEVIPKPENVIFSDLTWTSGTAEVTISTKTSDTIEYQVNGTTDGNWTQGTTVTGLNQGDVVYARLTNGTNTTEPEKLEVKDIIRPEEFNITVSNVTATSLSASGSTVDNQTEIKDYTYVAEASSGNKVEYTNITSTSYNITGLQPDTEYTVYMLAYDNAGNARKSAIQTVTTQGIEIITTTPIIGKTTTAASSVTDNSQTRGTTLYINFSATLDGIACTILNKDDNQSIPYAITKNGTYIFIVTGICNGKTITKEIDILVNKYQSATNLVKYDAGKWTQEEIDALDNSKLYDLNTSCDRGDGTFKLNSDSGLNFTFGGFKTGDSRNSSVNPQSGYGTTKYDGWQILKSEEVDGKTYVTELIHAGTPENFVYYHTADYDSYRAEYILSNGERQTSYNTLSDGTTIKTRNWDMYKDKSLDVAGYIKGVHMMTYSEANSTESSIRVTAGYYWLASARGYDYALWRVHSGGGIDTYINNSNVKGACWGIRPIVELNDGVYIASGSGTEADPYILGKD